VHFSDQGRDISEKIALGLAKPTMSKESMFDSRLFNQSEGISSGFRGGDDEGKHFKNIRIVFLT
jgi:SNW domain-containing protein 1